MEFRADANIRGDGVKSRGDKAFAFNLAPVRERGTCSGSFAPVPPGQLAKLPTAIPTELGRRGRQSPATPESRTFSEK